MRLVEVNEVIDGPGAVGHELAVSVRQLSPHGRRRGDGVLAARSAMPASKLEKHPWLKRLYAGYAFSIDYREARGHAYMLFDQEVTERVTQTAAERGRACIAMRR